MEHEEKKKCATCHYTEVTGDIRQCTNLTYKEGPEMSLAFIRGYCKHWKSGMEEIITNKSW